MYLAETMALRLRYISRQILVGILALQLLNISVGSQPASDTDYDYAYSYNKTYDPTETAVEWIVELKCGQQSRFSYQNHTDTGKNSLKAITWQADPGVTTLDAPVRPIDNPFPGEYRQAKHASPSLEIQTPPPQTV